MRAIWIVLAFVAAAALAWSLTSPGNVKRCQGHDADLAIGACTALIDSGHQTKAKLVAEYYDRAFAYSQKGLYDQALADYSQAIALEPDFAMAHNNRAWDYHLKGADALGLPDAETAVALAPSEADFMETRAEIYEKLGRRGEAVADYKATLKLDPGHRSAVEGLRRLGVAA